MKMPRVRRKQYQEFQKECRAAENATDPCLWLRLNAMLFHEESVTN
jgi:hypothetical protein